MSILNKVCLCRSRDPFVLPPGPRSLNVLLFQIYFIVVRCLLPCEDDRVVLERGGGGVAEGGVEI